LDYFSTFFATAKKVLK